MTLVVVDYGRGNMFSLGQALNHLGHDFVTSADPAVIAAADRIILPGVGAFGDGMAALRDHALVEPIVAAARAGKPVLGICLGMQLLAIASEEFGTHRGLGLVPGVVRRLPEGGMRIPNVGWRKLEADAEDFVAGADGQMVYFVHSYALEPEDPSVVAATISFNGTHAVAAIRSGALFGMQFHPEKSGPVGLELIRTFLDWH